MAIVQGIKEKCHLPLYDAFTVDAEQQLGEVERSSTLKFFVNVQGKTKLETNLQSASLLPHYNTFEARAMRVVISDLPPEFPANVTLSSDDPFTVVDGNDDPILVDDTGEVIVASDTTYETETNSGSGGSSGTGGSSGSGGPGGTDPQTVELEVLASFKLGLDRVMQLLTEARESPDRIAFIDVDEDGVTLGAFDPDTGDENVDIDPDVLLQHVQDVDGTIPVTVGDLESLLDGLDETDRPPKEQLDPNNGSGTVIGKLIYNTVTTLYVGEKIMIQMPTWFFPAGAGPYSETGKFTTHGEPSPMATFRFAEAIQVDRGQNFRVEMEIPDTDVLKEIQRIYGPLNIWVVLDGYMTRDVQ
jgi:hypothetical protein